MLLGAAKKCRCKKWSKGRTRCMKRVKRCKQPKAAKRHCTHKAYNAVGKLVCTSYGKGRGRRTFGPWMPRGGLPSFEHEVASRAMDGYW